MSVDVSAMIWLRGYAVPILQTDLFCAVLFYTCANSNSHSNTDYSVTDTNIPGFEDGSVFNLQYFG